MIIGGEEELPPVSHDLNCRKQGNIKVSYKHQRDFSTQSIQLAQRAQGRIFEGRALLMRALPTSALWAHVALFVEWTLVRICLACGSELCELCCVQAHAVLMQH